MFRASANVVLGVSCSGIGGNDVDVVNAASNVLLVVGIIHEEVPFVIIIAVVVPNGSSNFNELLFISIFFGDCVVVGIVVDSFCLSSSCSNRIWCNLLSLISNRRNSICSLNQENGGGVFVDLRLVVSATVTICIVVVSIASPSLSIG